MLHTQGPQEAIWNELQLLALQQYQHGEEQQPEDAVDEIAVSMLLPMVDRDLLLVHSELFFEYNGGVIQDMVAALLDPKRARYYVQSQDFEVDEAWSTEEYFGTKYVVKPGLLQVSTIEDVGMFGLPQTNPYICGQLGMEDCTQVEQGVKALQEDVKSAHCLKGSRVSVVVDGRREEAKVEQVEGDCVQVRVQGGKVHSCVLSRKQNSFLINHKPARVLEGGVTYAYPGFPSVPAFLNSPKQVSKCVWLQQDCFFKTPRMEVFLNLVAPSVSWIVWGCFFIQSLFMPWIRKIGVYMNMGQITNTNNAYYQNQR